MNRSSSRLIGWVIVLALPATVMAQVETQRGATMGGLAGAVVGGLIGERNNEPGAGAAIGGLVGAVTGGLLGNAADKEAQLRHQQHSYRQQQHHQRQQAALAAAVSQADVVTMSRNGLTDALIINQIQQRGIQRPLQVPDIIALHQAGVSENVITAMQQARPGESRIAQAPPTFIEERIVVPPPVIVEPAYVVPRYYPPPYPYRRHYPHRHRIHVHF